MWLAASRRSDEVFGGHAADLQERVRADGDRSRIGTEVLDEVRDPQPVGDELVVHRGAEQERVAELRVDAAPRG